MKSLKENKSLINLEDTSSLSKEIRRKVMFLKVFMQHAGFQSDKSAGFDSLLKEYELKQYLDTQFILQFIKLVGSDLYQKLDLDNHYRKVDRLDQFSKGIIMCCLCIKYELNKDKVNKDAFSQFNIIYPGTKKKFDTSKLDDTFCNKIHELYKQIELNKKACDFDFMYSDSYDDFMDSNSSYDFMKESDSDEISFLDF